MPARRLVNANRTTCRSAADAGGVTMMRQIGAATGRAQQPSDAKQRKAGFSWWEACGPA